MYINIYIVILLNLYYFIKGVEIYGINFNIYLIIFNYYI